MLAISIMEFSLLLVFAFCQSYGADKMFTFRGQLEFPSNGIYTDIPIGSCLSITVKEEIMDTAFGKISCEKTIKEFHFEGRVLEFEMMCKDIGSPLAISYHLNVGWCSTDNPNSDEWIRQDDYHNDVGYTIRNIDDKPVVEMKMDVSLYGDRVLCGIHRCDKKENCRPDENGIGYCECVGFDCPTSIGKHSGKTFVGTIILPKKGRYDQFPKSCIYVKVPNMLDLYVDNYRKGGGNDVNILSFEEPITKQLEGSRRFISATVIVKTGLPCSQFDKNTNTRRLGDYEGVAEILGNGQNNTLLVVNVKEVHKYMCGSQMCYSSQECVSIETGDSFCQCAQPYACGDLIEPEYVCSNTGHTYSSECWMKASDCFSGYVKKVHDGKCNENGAQHWFHNKVNTVSFVAGVVAICILIAAMVVFMHRYHKRRNLASQTCHQAPPVYEEVIKKPPPKDDEIKQKDKVADDMKFDDIYIDVPSGQPGVFERPPEYQQAVSFENNAYKA